MVNRELTIHIIHINVSTYQQLLMVKKLEIVADMRCFSLIFGLFLSIIHSAYLLIINLLQNS